VVLLAAAAALDAPAVALSWHEAGSAWIDTVLGVEVGTGRSLGRSRFEAAAYPASVRISTAGGAFVADATDGDPAERALVSERGFDGLLAVGAPAADGGWLLESSPTPARCRWPARRRRCARSPPWRSSRPARWLIPRPVRVAWPCTVDAGRRTAKGHSGRATGPFHGW
jgi:hypothetical protein